MVNLIMLLIVNINIILVRWYRRGKIKFSFIIVLDKYV